MERSRKLIFTNVIGNLVKLLLPSAGDERPPLQLHPAPGGLIDDLPDDLTYKILLEYLQRQSLKTVLNSRCASRALRQLIDKSIASKQMSRDDVWLVSPHCKMESQRICFDVLDLARGEKWQIALPAELQSRAATEFYAGNTLSLRPVAGHFGSGLIILETFSSSASYNLRHRVIFNPLKGTNIEFPTSGTDERGQHFDYMQRICRLRNLSEYLVWGEALPQIIEPRTGSSRKIPSATQLKSNGSVQFATASVGDISYIRYEAKELRSLIIEYHVSHSILCEKETQGLPESLNSKYDHLFEHQGGIYLGTVLSGPESEIDSIVIFKLKTAESEALKWTEVSRVPSEMLAEISGLISPRLARGLRFILMKEVLFVIGGPVGTPRSRGSNYMNVMTYNFARGNWEHDEATSLLASDFQSFVFTPRFDIQA